MVIAWIDFTWVMVEQDLSSEETVLGSARLLTEEELSGSGSGSWEEHPWWLFLGVWEGIEGFLLELKWVLKDGLVVVFSLLRLGFWLVGSGWRGERE